MLNKTIIQGRMVANPELRQTTNGTAVCSFRVAWSETAKDRETKLFLPCVAWSSTAELISRYFPKGKEILLEGRLSTREYEARDGQKRNSTELTVDRVHFCGKKEDSGEKVSYEELREVEEDGDLPF